MKTSSILSLTRLAAMTGMLVLSRADAKATSKDIVTGAGRAGNFIPLVAAVKATGLVETLQGTGPFTVFAPNDEVFAKQPKRTVENLLKPENKETRFALLTYHVVSGKVSAAAEVSERHSRRDGEVKCSGWLLPKPAHLTTGSRWAAVPGANLTSVFEILQSATARMMKSGGLFLVNWYCHAIHGERPKPSCNGAEQGAVTELETLRLKERLLVNPDDAVALRFSAWLKEPKSARRKA